MSEEALESMFTECDTGVYYGWAQVGEVGSVVYPMVMSLGWNPYYKNEKRSAVSSMIKNMLYAIKTDY
jgi:riboflavin kinase